MKLTVNDNELIKVFKFIKNLNIASVNKGFNKLFSDESIKHVAVIHDQENGTSEIELDDEVSMLILDLLIDNGYSLGQLKDARGIGLLNKVKSLYDHLKYDFYKIGRKFK